MASYLQIENISKSYGPKILFEHIGFNVNEGDKIALIAPNGTGKTSLMRILAGKDKSDSGGKILFLKDIRIAFLEQEYDFDPERSIFDQIIAHSADATAGFHQERREEFERKVHEFLSNFKLLDHSRLMKGLSGGEIKRVALSEMLALEAEFLIMDEPTNHLDIEAIEYLEGYLKRSRCTLLMVTHDRYFLDRVCNTVMELDHGAIYTYKGDYQNYLEKRDERIQNYNAETDKVRNILRRELEWIHATPCARSGKAKYRINAFHELADRASQAYTTKQITLEGVGAASRLGTKIIDCKKVDYFWEDWCLLKDFTYNFQRYDKIGIVGRNGVGKSTFLDLLTGVIEPTAGVLERGESLKIGYYRQSGMDFTGDQTVLETVNDTRLLGRFLFPHDMLSTRVSRLSGGEKRRLYLLTILMKEPNLLILDEPTNDLDIVTLNILEEYLKEFKGSLLIVSHDRHFLDRVADHLLVFCGDGVVKDFIGNFSEYRSYIKDYEAQMKESAKKAAGIGSQKAGGSGQMASVSHGSQTDSDSVASQKGEGASGNQKGSSGGQIGSSANQRGSSGAQNKPRKLSYKEKRELEAIEEQLPLLEDEKAQLETAMSSGTMPYEQLQAASSRIQDIIAQLDELETRWLELQG